METATAGRFQFSLLQLVLFTLAAGVLLGFFMWAPWPTAGVFFIFILPAFLRYTKILKTEAAGAIGVIALMLALMLPALMSHTHPNRRFMSARNKLKGISLALERYHYDFKAYPPDAGNPGSSGSEILTQFLLQPLSHPRTGPYQPYLSPHDIRIKDFNNDGKVELASPFGGHYEYKILRNADGSERGALVVDCGKDNLLGGTLDAREGFVPDGSDANRDGVPDDKDNLFNDR